MNWLIKINATQFEVWSDSEHKHRLMKCEYYGATPFWEKIRILAPLSPNDTVKYDVGEIIPYKHSSTSSFGKRFAVIIKLFTEAGQAKFLGIDIETKSKIVSQIA
ncbi:MAG: hypothetical protein KF860_16850 [Cyclobacteriaceae bacterium]|nr:hypothetical protein [Cyclobacteriaceae bacterium]